ncbi:MAG: DUF4426 domain-containing protein [Pseudomonadota bacterium]
MRKLTAAFAGLLVLLISLPASAETSTRVDGYTIHHNAITTDMLTPEIARAYRIVRSRNRGMLNVSVIKDQEDTTGTPVPADVRVYSTNIVGQRRPIYVREIREGDAVYYIGDFLVRHGETMNFHIDVRPKGAATFFTAEMSQEFFTRY